MDVNMQRASHSEYMSQSGRLLLNDLPDCYAIVIYATLFDIKPPLFLYSTLSYYFTRIQYGSESKYL